MSAFFEFLSTLMWCGVVFAIASVIALSLPKSRLRVVLSEVLGWAFCGLCVFYFAVPTDILPEALLGPAGYLDDLGAAAAGWVAVKSALKSRQERKEFD